MCHQHNITLRISESKINCIIDPNKITHKENVIYFFLYVDDENPWNQ